MSRLILLLLILPSDGGNKVRFRCYVNYFITARIHGSDKIQQVFLNILVNALQAIPNGGELTVSSEWRPHGYPPGGMRDNHEGEGVLITFTDTGIGIPEKDLNQIFEPLYTTKYEGTGLGVAIAKRIIRAHGGTISVQSGTGVGSCLGVWLPVA
jgi:signal transduction histidine kinase